jgi:hypothetical protein
MANPLDSAVSLRPAGGWFGDRDGHADVAIRYRSHTHARSDTDGQPHPFDRHSNIRSHKYRYSRPNRYRNGDA